jgi:protein transport protein SEC61 subunit beta
MPRGPQVKQRVIKSAAPPPASNIVRVYTTDTPGLKLGPQTVLMMSLIFIGIVIVLHILSKFRKA